MSSYPSSGPYQSRVFNFIAKRSRQLGDGLGLLWRRTKVASRWGLQLLLYPIYVALQSTRVVRQRLHAKQQPTPPEGTFSPAKETSPTQQIPTDTPIQQVLGAIGAAIVSPEEASEAKSEPATEVEPATSSLPKSRGLPAWIEKTIQRFSILDTLRSRHWWHQYASNDRQPTAATSDTTPQQQLFYHLERRELEIEAIPLPASQSIQSVATQRDRRTLVLVTPEQEIIDILSPQQRQAICQRIAKELSHYHRREIAPVTSAALEAPSSQKYSWWERLWGWMQTSPIAVKANLFSESNLVAQQEPSSLPSLRQPGNLPVENDPQKALEMAFLDWVCCHSPQTWRRFGAALECAIAKRESSDLTPSSDLGTVLIQRGGTWLQHEPRQWRHYQIQFHWGQPLADPPRFPQAQQYIYELIQTAIAYFFARRLHAETDDSQPHASAADGDRDPISWGDRMFQWWQNVKAGTLPPYRYPQFERIQENENWLTMEELFGKAKAYCITKLEDTPTAAVVESSPNHQTTSNHQPTPNFASSQLSSHPGWWETTDGEWIDTEAISLGYERHPLQIILEKLDQFMLWLETWWDQIWQWCRQKLQQWQN